MPERFGNRELCGEEVSRCLCPVALCSEPPDVCVRVSCLRNDCLDPGASACG